MRTARDALCSEYRQLAYFGHPAYTRFMSEETIFSKIIRREVPSDIVYQDELVTAFRDIQPQAPVHVLIIPNEIIPTAADVEPRHEAALGRLFTVARKIAEQEGLEGGYRLMVNCKEHGGQEVYHLHMHLLGGGRLGRMLCGPVGDERSGGEARGGRSGGRA